MRLKIIAGNLIAVVLVGLVSYYVVRSELNQGLASDIQTQITHDQTLFSRSWRLSALDLLEDAKGQAASRDVVLVFSALDERSRRERAFKAAEGVARWFQDPARGRRGAPDVTAITDDNGRVVARDKDVNRMYNESLLQVLPGLREVLREGRVHHDVWLKKDENKLLQTAICPVHGQQGEILGALVIGFDMSNGLAQSEAGVLDRDVAFVTDNKVYSSSLSSDAVGTLREYLFGPLAEGTRAALAGTQASTVWTTTLGAQDYVGVLATLPMVPSGKVVGVVLANKSKQLELADVSYMILILTALGALGVLIYGSIVGTSLLRPLEQIEEGVLAVINGNTQLRLDVQSAEFGGLAYRINQLINVFTGVSEEDEEGRVSSRPEESQGGEEWQGSAFSEASSTSTAAVPDGQQSEVIDDPAVAQTIAAEPEEQYFTRIHNEYLSAKKALGEDVSNITKDRFVQRLRGTESTLIKKYACRAVRFQVQTRANQIVLRPVLIR